MHKANTKTTELRIDVVALLWKKHYQKLLNWQAVRGVEAMEQKNYELAKTLKQELSGVVNLVDFRVFGSMARGDEGEYSDMDVFLEVESISKELKEKIFNIVWEVGFKHFVFISPLIFTRDEVEKSPLRLSPVVRNIMDEGVVV